MTPEQLYQRKLQKSVKQKANETESRFAKKHGGKPTPLSGATVKSKADVVFKGVRLEHKQTESSSISIKKEWLEKLKNGCHLSEIPALAVNIQGETWVMVRESEFDYILDRVKEDKYDGSRST